MVKEIGKYGFGLVMIALFIFPIIASGQDLGSSNGLFRSPNPKTAAKKPDPAPEKKSAPKTVKKSAAKPAVARTGPKRSSSKSAAAFSAKSFGSDKINVRKGNTGQISAVGSVKQTAAKNPVQKNIVITVGQTNPAEVDKLFDQAIEEGNAARDERHYVAAEGAYHRAQSLKPRDSRAIYGLGNIFNDQQRWEEAEKAYRQAVEFDPQSPEAYIALSFVLTQPVVGVNLSERFTEAEKAARKAVQLDPGNALAFDQLGVALELRGQIGSETRNAYRKAVQLDPGFALAYAHLGRLLRRNGLNNESNLAYRDAIRLSLDIPTMILVADVMQSQQRFTESEQLLRRALAGDPKNPTALFLLGRALTTSGKFEEAEKLLKTSVQVSPNSFVSYTSLGSLYARRGNFAEAEKILMRALRVVSPNEKKRLAQEFEAVGDGLMRVGRRNDAARVYRQAIMLDEEKKDLTAKLTQAEKS